MTFERLRPASHNEIPDELSVLHIKSEAFSHELHSRYCFDSPWPLFFLCAAEIFQQRLDLDQEPVQLCIQEVSAGT